MFDQTTTSVQKRKLIEFSGYLEKDRLRFQSYSKIPVNYNGRFYFYIEPNLIPSDTKASTITILTIAYEGEEILDCAPLVEVYAVVNRVPSLQPGFDLYSMRNLLGV